VQAHSNIQYVSLLGLAAIFMMFSCASRTPPYPMTVHVPAHFSGKIHIMACAGDASMTEVSVDERGEGKTALCPALDHTVEMEVTDGDRRINVPASEVHISRTGDGIATSIEAQIL
jgi:hypothetical protein